MLYVSTRNRTDSYTAHRALHDICAPDDGMFVPFQLPIISDEELRFFHSRTFSENIAYILNLFFSVNLPAWDVEVCIGKYPIELVALPRKLMVAECWHSLSSEYTRMENALYSRLCGQSVVKPATEWAKIAIRIAFLFAIYGELEPSFCRKSYDLSVHDNCFTTPMAAWYARRMGLPIGRIICANYENSDTWDLLHRGDLDCDSNTLRASGLECLIYMTLGPEETVRFINACYNGESYLVDDEKLPLLNEGLFSAVVSKERVQSTINNIYRSSDYITDTVAAISYSALQDYRARTGEGSQTLILSLENPANHARELARVLGLSAADIEKKVSCRKG